MSEENVEVVRQAYEAFNDGQIGTVLDLLDPEIEWNASDVFFDQPRTYQGRRTWFEEFLRDLMELFEEYRAEPEEIRDAGEQVVSIVRVGGPGRKSGAEVTALVAHVMTISDGQVVRFTEFKDPAEAFEAAGLEE
jgi:ketosteroid isomerase-like protein